MTRSTVICAVMLTLAVAAPLFAQPSPQAPSAAEQDATRLLQAADWPHAVTAFKELSSNEPDNPRAWFGLGVALHESGQYPAAVAALVEAQKRGFAPGNQVTLRLARAYARLDDSARALTALEQLAASGFVNVQLLTVADFKPLEADPRFKQAVERVNRNAHPCEFDPEFRKFDFWIGDWDVQQTGAPRGPVGASSKVERILDGCVLQENWAPPSGPAGKSFNVYNTVSRKWEQFWVDTTGRVTHYFGEFHDDGNLYYEADQPGTKSKVRMTFFNQGADQVRQLGHVSTDDGKTWTASFDLTYIRKK